MKTVSKCSLVLVSLLVVLMYAVSVQAQKPTTATAELVDVDGVIVGVATFEVVPEGVLVAVNVDGLEGSEGEHGIHIHQTGSCTPDFSAAGGHFNPSGAQHGLDNPEGAHSGDMPNLQLNADGTATYESINEQISLGSDDLSLFDDDGSAIIIHAGPDDQVTDPTGNSGDRIACGIITADETMAGAAEAEAAETETEMTQTEADEGEAQVTETTQTEEPPATLPQSGAEQSYPLVLIISAGVVMVLSGLALSLKRVK